MEEKKRGRPKIQIDENALVAMAERGWSIPGIAAAFGVTPETIRDRFSAKIESARQHGKEKLLDVLWQRAVKEKSDRILENLADRIIGPRPRIIENAQQQSVNVQVNQYTKVPREKLTEEIDKLMAEQKLLGTGEE